MERAGAREQAECIKERSQNIFWTVQGDYEKKLPEPVSLREMVKAKHDATLWGAVLLYADASLIERFIGHLAENPKFYDAFCQILWIALEQYCMPKLYLERPAVVALFSAYYQELAAGEELPQNAAQIIEQAYYKEKLGELSSKELWLKALFHDIFQAARSARDTAELLEAIEAIFPLYFKKKSWIEEAADKEENQEAYQKMPIGYQPEDSFFRKKRSVVGAEVEQLKIVDAEFNPNSYRGRASEKYVEAEREKFAGLADSAHKGKQTELEKVWQFFGDPILPLSELAQIEQKISTGLHRHKKLYISDGSFAATQNEYQLRFLREQRMLNLEYLEVHYHSCRRHIENLRLLLMNALRPEAQEESYRSKDGRLLAGQVWRSERLQDHKIFERQTKQEIGNFAVELLLDGSGSQCERQAQVAFQGYILAEALSLCRIPCRISSYATFLDYTILRQYKDYDSPRSQNERIFDFFGTGMNRDGFALRAVAERLEKRQEENKILIVLSDGKPNDVRVFKKAAQNPEAKEYAGDIAVNDTAKEVRRLRLKGISVLGVFTGKEEDLSAQQRIYGKEFAYIKKLDQFSKIVGAYLKKELRRFW